MLKTKQTNKQANRKPETHLTLLRVSAVGVVVVGVDLRFRGRPGPRRAGLLETSSFLSTNMQRHAVCQSQSNTSHYLCIKGFAKAALIGSVSDNGGVGGWCWGVA